MGIASRVAVGATTLVGISVGLAGGVAVGTGVYVE